MSSPRRKRPKPKPNSSPSPSLPSWAVDPPPALFPSRQELLRLVTVLAIASSVAIACNYFVSFLNPKLKPFCDTSLDFPHSLTDSCQPCPSNGECYQGKLECLHGYKKHGNLCIEDGDINETAKKLSEFLEYHLCKPYAQVLCDGSGSIWVQEDDISKDLDEHELMKNFESKSDIFFYTKKRTMDTISSFLESRTNSYGIKEWKCPDLLAEHYKPFSCRIRQWVSKHALIIVPVCALVLHSERKPLSALSLVSTCCSLLTILRYTACGMHMVTLETPPEMVCEILEENALMSKSENGECEPWIVASWLRDHLLLPKERKDPVIWKKVDELVQEDSRVDQYPKLLRGESKVVWEWQVEGSLSSSRMRKKGEANKSKSAEGRDMNFDQQHLTLKAEPKALIF